MNSGSLVKLYGNNAAWQLLVNDHLKNHLAHAYIFTGPKGIGKLSTVKEYIKYLLQANEVLTKRIEEGNFLDLLYISKQDKNEITIDNIRKTKDFFNQTPAECQYKFVIIDDADDLNHNAANALLKILEEPTKNTHIFLISHAPYKLLATIRSRCRVINFKPLTQEKLKQITKFDQFTEIEDFIAGSPGRTIFLEEVEGLKIYKQLLELIEKDDILMFNKFADNLIKQPQLWLLATELLSYLLSNCIKLAANCLNLEQILEEEQMLLPKLMATGKSIEDWFIIYDQFKQSVTQTEIYNLDKKKLLFFTLANIH